MSDITRTWSYEDSVERMRPLVARWKSVTDEFLGELYRAREELSRPGTRTDLVTNDTRSWAGYLDDIGLNRMTVHRWLEQYDPETGTRIEPPKPEPKEEPRQKARPAAPADPEPEDASFWEPDEDEDDLRVRYEDDYEEEDVPTYTDADSPTEWIMDYIERILSTVATDALRHEVANNVIKQMRVLSIDYNRKIV